MNRCTYESPIGTLILCEEEGSVSKLYLQNNSVCRMNLAALNCGADALLNSPASETLCEAYRQLDEYFSGRRISFDLPLAPKGTPFQLNVWNELKKVPYGSTACYQDIALGIGNIKASRAVGQAVNKNPLMIIIPCHRIISKNGSIGGFACGTHIKKYLLSLEESHVLNEYM